MTMKVSDLKPNEKNPRRISDKQKERLKKSLEEFGDLSGIVYNKRSGKLIAGHQRAEILKDAIVDEENKVIRVADGTEYIYREVDWDQKKEVEAMIAANAHGGEWEEDSLRQLVEDTPDIDFDLIGLDEDLFQDIDDSEIENFYDPGLTDSEDNEKEKPSKDKAPSKESLAMDGVIYIKLDKNNKEKFVSDNLKFNEVFDFTEDDENYFKSNKELI